MSAVIGSTVRKIVTTRSWVVASWADKGACWSDVANALDFAVDSYVKDFDFRPSDDAIRVVGDDLGITVYYDTTEVE